MEEHRRGTEERKGRHYMKKLQDRIGLVTGAGSGIGRSAALAFAREGAKVVVADIVTQGGEETVQMIKNAGGEAIFVKSDVTQEAQVEALIKKAIDTYGRLDCAFNNAGIDGETTGLVACSQELFDRVMNINVKAVWLCMKYEIAAMLKQGKGAIVNTSSIAGLTGLAGNPGYVASKHGVLGLTRMAALENAKTGIRVNAICPAAIATPMVKGLLEKNPAMEPFVVGMQPMGRLGQPEEVADAVVWLCSDESSFITGHPLPLDGGMMAQ